MVEMLVSIAIASVIVVMGLPAFGTVIQSVRLDGHLSALNAALNLARTEAIKRGQIVAVCPGTMNCDDSAIDWTLGWNVVLMPDTTALVLAKTAAYSKGETLTITHTSSESYPHFTPLGYTFFNGTLSLHAPDRTPDMRRCIRFNAGMWTLNRGAVCP